MLALAFRSATFTPISATPSWPVLGFAFLLSLLTGVVFGVVPAWFASHSDPAEALHGANRSTREAFVAAAEDAGHRPGCALAGAAGLRRTAAPACATWNIRTWASPRQSRQRRHQSTAAQLHPGAPGCLYRAIEDRLLQLPNVQSASLALYSPLSRDNWGEYGRGRGQGRSQTERRECFLLGPG